jgi:hypothetical protein
MTTSDSAERDFPKLDAPQEGDDKQWLNWRTVAFFFGLLALNYILASALVNSASRVEIPYNPTFLQQVGNGNVAPIGAKESAIQGTFKRAVRYPASDKNANPTTRFKTEVPEFANADRLDQLLRDNGVVVKAQPAGTPWWQTLLYSVGPALLFIGLWIWLIRRYGARPVACSPWAGRSRGSTSRPRSASRSTTWRESTRPRRSWPRSSTSSAMQASTASSGRAFREASS